MLDQEALDKINRNLQRCQKDPLKLIPVEIFRRDVSSLMADIASRAYDVDLGVISDPATRHRTTLFIFKTIIPNADRLLDAMKAPRPNPAYVYEEKVKQLLNLRWEIISNPNSERLRKSRLFVAEIMREFGRMERGER